jgi:putative hydrolase of the HAD superfamily
VTRPRIRTVLFDFDRTLGQAKSHYGMYVRAAEEYGVAVTEAQLGAAQLDDAWAQWDTPLGPDHSAESADEATFAEVRREIARVRFHAAGVDCADDVLGQITARVAELEGHADQYMIYDDTVPALERLGRSGVQSLIVSNHVWRLPEIIRALGISARFEGVITSARVGVRKPHPRIFEAAMRLAATGPDETIYVGDSYKHDVLGARGVGMDAILIDRDGRTDGQQLDVTVIHTLDELQLP